MIREKYKYPQTNFFVSIGAGVNQKPLIEEAIKLGFHIIGVDKNISAAGIHRCDIIIQEPIENYKEIYIKLGELLVDGNMNAVLSKSFGHAIKSACFVSDKLNIPMIPFERIDDFIDKKRMKNIFIKNGIKSPPYKIHDKVKSKATIKKSEFPLVIKPLTGHAKISVKLLENNSDLEMYFKKDSKNISMKEK